LPKPTVAKKAARPLKTKTITSSLQEDEKPYIAAPLLFCGIGGFRIAIEKAGGACFRVLTQGFALQLYFSSAPVAYGGLREKTGLEICRRLAS